MGGGENKWQIEDVKYVIQILMEEEDMYYKNLIGTGRNGCLPETFAINV